MSNGTSLSTLYVWVSEYPDGSIGVVGGGFLGGGVVVPLVTRDPRVAYSFYRPWADMHKQETGQRVWLRKYTTFEDEADI